MNVNLLETIVSLQGIEIIMQLFISLIMVFYLVFAFLIVRQVKMLNKSFQTDAAFLLTSFAYGHFFATLLLLLFTVATIL
jgi:hypothetical protein